MVAVVAVIRVAGVGVVAVVRVVRVAGVGVVAVVRVAGVVGRIMLLLGFTDFVRVLPLDSDFGGIDWLSVNDSGRKSLLFVGCEAFSVDPKLVVLTVRVVKLEDLNCVPLLLGIGRYARVLSVDLELVDFVFSLVKETFCSSEDDVGCTEFSEIDAVSVALSSPDVGIIV